MHAAVCKPSRTNLVLTSRVSSPFMPESFCTLSCPVVYSQYPISVTRFLTTSTLYRASSHAFRIIASLFLSLSPSPRISPFGLFRLYPFTRTFFIFLPNLPRSSSAPIPPPSHFSPGVPRPRVFAAFLLASLTPSTTFLVSRLSLSRNPSLRARSLILLLLLPPLSLLLPPCYRMLVLALTLNYPLAASRSFCSLSSFARRALCTPSVRSSVRSLAHPPRHRHHRHRCRRHPLLRASEPPFLSFTPALPAPLLDSSCVIDVRRCTGPPDIFHVFVT